MPYSPKCTPPHCFFGKIAEKTVWRSALWTIWHRILNVDSTKTPPVFLAFLPAGRENFTGKSVRVIEVSNNRESTEIYFAYRCTTLEESKL